MDTSLAIDNSSKQLLLRFKKDLEHAADVRLRVRGHVNTATAAVVAEGALMKFFRVGPAPSAAPGEAFRPDARTRLGVGAVARTGDDEVRLRLSATQRLRLHRAQDVVRGRAVLRSYTQAKVTARWDYSPATEAGEGEAAAAVSHAVFRAFDDTDVRVTAGVAAPLGPGGVDAARAAPFLRLQENCWGVRFDQKGGWRVTYDL